MTLPIEVAPTITGRGAIAIIFHIPDPDNLEDVQFGNLTVQIKRSDGEVIERTYNLLNRLTDDTEGQNTHLPNLNSLKTYILNRIDTEILGL